MLEIRLKTLTPLWTGGVDQRPDRLHETGLIGSLRWWYEALVRGMGGFACDPTTDDRCPDADERRCAACEAFGCTGWARKFRLRVLDKKGQLIQDALRQNMEFRVQFLPLRSLEPGEGWLLAKTVEIAARYGALGGKTTLKPQPKPKVGNDYGIVSLVSGASSASTREQAERHLKNNWQRPGITLPDLRWFFFLAGGFLERPQMNRLMGLSEDGRRIDRDEEFRKFLRGQRGAGNQAAVSKKLFSFRADKGRVWGYARDAAMRDTIITQIRAELGNGAYTIKTGEEVLHEL